MTTHLTPFPSVHDNQRVFEFLHSWTTLGQPGQSQLLADSVLIGLESGTTIISRDAFLAGVRSRQAQVGGNVASQLTDWSAITVGRALILATATWAFDAAGLHELLVSDLLLQDARDGGLQCAAYLPRQDVTAGSLLTPHPSGS